MITRLRAWKAVHSSIRLKRGEAWIDLDLVFTDAIGRPHAIQRVEGAFAAILRREGLPPVRLYDLPQQCYSTDLRSLGASVPHGPGMRCLAPMSPAAAAIRAPTIA